MKQLQFDSPKGNFHALEIPKHVMGCEGIFWCYKMSTNLQVGKIYGEEGNFMPAYTGETLSENDLWEILNLMKTVKKYYENLPVS